MSELLSSKVYHHSFIVSFYHSIIGKIMKKILLSLLIVSFVIASCTKVPVTGRKQLSFLPESQLTSMSLGAYQDFMSKATVVNSTNNADAQVVKKTGQRIAGAVEAYLRQNGYASRVKDFKWEFNLVQENVANAWAMPGGKVAIYTGILPIAKTEAGLAVVMGHEVAHAVARHGNERMSLGLIQQLGGMSLALALRNKPAQTQGMFNQAYALGSQLGGMLPFSRKHETEADELGLIFMAMAGYDPKEAPKFWQRMSQGAGQAPPEFMSTHPSSTTRSSNLAKFIPKAMRYFKPSNQDNSYVFNSNYEDKKPVTTRPGRQNQTTKPQNPKPRDRNQRTNSPTKKGTIKGSLRGGGGK